MRRGNDNVFNKRCGTFFTAMMAQEIETFVANSPIFLGVFFVNSNIGFKSERGNISSRRFGTSEHLSLFSSGKFSKEYELWDTARKCHKEFRNKIDCKLKEPTRFK